MGLVNDIVYRNDLDYQSFKLSRKLVSRGYACSVDMRTIRDIYGNKITLYTNELTHKIECIIEMTSGKRVVCKYSKVLNEYVKLRREINN